MTKYDCIFSDSSTCTADPDPSDYNQSHKIRIEDRKGNEFYQAMQNRNSNAWYEPWWGKGLEKIEWQIQNYKSYNFQRIVVIIAGNDIHKGAEKCQELLDKILAHGNVEVISVIPKYSMTHPFPPKQDQNQSVMNQPRQNRKTISDEKVETEIKDKSHRAKGL